MLIWGRNNNHLFRHNHKKTYSLPQKIPISRPILKCVAGYDYILILSQPASLSCYYQNAFYQLNNFKNVAAFATTDNMIVIVNTDGTAWIMEFNAEKIISEQLTASKIPIRQHVSNVFMNYGDIFLVCQSHNVFHLKRNQWYETKTYSDPTPIQGLDNKHVKIIAPAVHSNYFLTDDGQLWKSTKKQPNRVISCKITKKFISIQAADYFLGISENGKLYIWGQYYDRLYQNMTQFGKLSQNFRSIAVSNENGFAVTCQGQAWVWGKNANGELGVSDYEPRMKPFPLITLQKQRIKDIFVGQGFTVCLVQLQGHKKCAKSYAVERIVEKDIQRSKHKKYLSRDDSSIQRSENKSLSKQNALKPIRTEMLRNSSSKSKKSKLDDKQLLKGSQKCKSSLNTGKYNHEKSPSCHSFKSPIKEHRKEKSLSNVSYSKLKGQVNSKEKRDVSSSKKKANSEMKQLQQQNSKLKKLIGIKDTVIEDITSKIRMLEDAIEEYEKNSTARDHLMEEYQRRQKEYQVHIDELQKSIQTLIKGKSEQQNAEEYFSRMYKNLKTEFNSEKQHYFNKMRGYQQELKAERGEYKSKIKQLEGEVLSYRSRIELNYEENSQPASFQARTVLKENNSSCKKGQDRHTMDRMISKIQQNKMRIGKSASKLTEMLQN